jgi:hypothetical protein
LVNSDNLIGTSVLLLAKVGLEHFFKQCVWILCILRWLIAQI